MQKFLLDEKKPLAHLSKGTYQHLAERLRGTPWRWFEPYGCVVAQHEREGCTHLKVLALDQWEFGICAVFFVLKREPIS